MTYIYVYILLYIVLWNQNQVCSKQKPKSVTTLIEAKWNETPLVLEVTEYLANENQEYFWTFIDSLTSLTPTLSELDNDLRRYEVIIEQVAPLIPFAQISLMKLALSLHLFSAKVEMFNQMAVQRKIPETNCRAVADVAGHLTCNILEIDDLLKTPLSLSVDRYSVDHEYSGSLYENTTIPIVILYAELGTPEFNDFHSTLKNRANEGSIRYLIRHYVKEPDSRKTRLSGYGVELQIKSTEYKVMDDSTVQDGANSGDFSENEDPDEEIEGLNFFRLKNLYPDKYSQLDLFRTHLLDTSNEMAPLKVWQVQELSLQAAQRIISAPKEEALKVFIHIAQNFPLQARSLTKIVVDPHLRKESNLNQERFSSALTLQPSDTALFINGLFFDLDIIDIASLLDVIGQELHLMDGLHSIGVPHSQIATLLALDLGSNSGNGGLNGGRGGTSGGNNGIEYALDIRDSAVRWINDIENDPQYRRWPSTLSELLRPTFPGMLRSIRRNLYHLVLVIDPSISKSWPLLRLAESFLVHNAPLRIGLVIVVNSSNKITGLNDGGVALLCAFNYISETSGLSQGLGFITEVYASVSRGGTSGVNGSEDESSTDKIISVQDVWYKFKQKYPKVSKDEIFGEDSDYDTGRQLAKDFISRTGLNNLPQVLLNGVPLDQEHLNGNDFEEAVLSEIISQTPLLQKAVYKGDLSDSDDTLDYIMSQPNIMPRLNDRILNPGKEWRMLELSTFSSRHEDLDYFSKLNSRDKTASLMNFFLNYMEPKFGSGLYMLSHWLILDLKQEKARNMLLDALIQMKSSGNVRIGVITNIEETPDPISLIVLAATKALEPGQRTQFVKTFLEDLPIIRSLLNGDLKPSEVRYENIDPENKISGEIKWAEKATKIHQIYTRQVIKLQPEQAAVISNGRFIGPFNDNETFTQEDFALLERYSLSSYGDKLLEALKKTKNEDSISSSDELMKVVSLLVTRPQSRNRFEIPFSGDQHSVIKIPAKNSDQPSFDVTAIVDPVSRGAQKLGPILSVLHETINCNIRVFFNCIDKHSDMPLKSFYRYVVEPEILFLPDGSTAPGPMAKFTNLPISVLLTQNMQVPENWLVESVTSPYDLDNIKLEDVESGVHSVFELEYLLLEGHCFEVTLGNPPRGLQITLGTERDPVLVDTIVMANLGYFQLKANPGAWLLRLRQGRSADIYEIVSHEGSDTPPGSSDIHVILSSLRSSVLKLRVQKRPGKQNMNLLSDDDQASGIWNSITNTLGGGRSDDETEEKINIFSLASGHLYERFLKIMMVSVLKNTKTPVKFWFLKNYLSPTLKDFLPIMAKEYGFEYELVQYKWPRWLHQQTEKQRIIWGYKILFLDVLFPLDVKKIIFVDADQVVRADMKELVDLDLGGSPYGYTPFCESRTEMEGFRFWKQGYWRNHLQGRRYHISALYVVDLKRFRRIAAGDRLRGQYQALSQDPNSLANLDQDLPNNMIHQVGIKSLPQEWLWCETWCNDESKKNAKTIDLCNNPQTKEAKLTAAIRIIAEWKDYDNEIKQLQDKTYLHHSEFEDEVFEEINLAESHTEL